MNKQNLLNLISKAQTVNQKILKFLANQSNENGKISVEKLDKHQVLAWEASWIKSSLTAATQLVDYADKLGNEFEGMLAEFYVADTLQEVSTKVAPHIARVGLSMEEMGQTVWSVECMSFISEKLAPQFFEKLADKIIDKNSAGDKALTDDQKLIQETFRKYAEDIVMPKAEHIHKEDLIIPNEILQGLKEMGCFGLSIPQKYGGFQDDAQEDNMGMVIVTEELSRGSLGAAGSLITRPEIMSKALLKGGTEEQKSRLLPQIAMGEKMCAVAVTEPDYGSDVAGMKVTATKVEGGYKINGVKTWCTFAGYADLLLVLCRTDSDLSKGHKGLSILIAEKPRFEGHDFSYDQPEGGHIEGKAISTIGYRGMHSFEVSFENYFVPENNLVGGSDGLGKGFYLQMAGFSGGRLQTAARAVGLMEACMDKALSYSAERHVFDNPINSYQVAKFKLVRMAALIQACRQLTYHSARLMDKGQGQMEASLVKFYSCRIAEWVAREALQLHGGYGYAEEYAVSRYYVDARVLSIFEGAEDVLALRVIARSLVADAL